MTTYTVTTSNWYDPSFWSGINEHLTGHTLDFSDLGSDYTLITDESTGIITISDGVTTFTIGESGVAGTDANLGGTTLLDFFTSLLGIAGNDTIEGTVASDNIEAGAGDDLVRAGAGNDTVLGEAGNDLLLGDAGDDSLIGGAGNDVVYLEGGTDTALGGAGEDIFYVIDNTSVNSVIIGGETAPDNDRVALDNAISGVTVTFTGDEAGRITDNASSNTLTSFSEIEVFDLTDSADYVDASATTAGVNVAGELGDDTMIGGTGTDNFTSGDGDDVLATGAANDTVFGGTGNDSIDGGTGDDLILAQSGDDTISLGDNFGNDTITGGESGETNGDTLDLSGTTTGVTVDLTANDPEAGAVSDGTDTATFSKIENITLGGGRDTVTLADGGGSDTVQSFDMTDSGDGTTNDQLDVSGMTDADSNPVNALDVVVTDTNGDGTGDAILTFPNGESITLVGVTPDQVDSAPELNAIGIPCFTPGIKIATMNGEKPVEDIRPGDKVLTVDNGHQMVRWVGQRTLGQVELAEHPNLRPIVIRKGAFGNACTMRVSPQHGIVIPTEDGEKLIRAKHAAEQFGGKIARVDRRCEFVTYIHIMFEQHELVFADGMRTESFYPGPVALSSFDSDTHKELLTLFPELAQVAYARGDILGAYGRPARSYLRRKDVKTMSRHNP